MAHISEKQYERLSNESNYSATSGVYLDKTTGNLVVIRDGTVIATLSASGIAADLEFTSEARGDIIRRGASSWGRYAANTSGQLLIGDGTDIVSAAMSGDATLAGTGALSLIDRYRKRSATSVATVGAGSYTAAALVGGLILRDPAGASRTDTTATAAEIVAALTNSVAGAFVVCTIVNTADAPETITLAGGANVTLSPTTITIARGQAATLLLRADNVGSGTEAVTAYLLTDRIAPVNDLGAQAVGYFDATGVGADTETVTINGRAYELDTHDASTITAGNVRVNVSGGSTVKSQGTLTFAENAVDTNTVTIGTKTYTFQDVLTNVDGNVLKGANAGESRDNLVAAINLAAGGGTTYAAATTVHPTVTAAAGGGDTMVATAKAGGVEGDTIGTSDTLAGASAWDAINLGTTTAGVSPPATEVATALVAAINADASRSVDAYDVGDGTVLLVAKAAGSTNFTLAEATANITRSAATMVGAAAAAVRTTHRFHYAVTAADVTVTTDQNGAILVGGIAATTAPSAWIVQVRDANGAVKVSANIRWSWVQLNTNFYALRAVETQIGATDFVNTDTVDVIVIE